MNINKRMEFITDIYMKPMASLEIYLLLGVGTLTKKEFFKRPQISRPLMLLQ